MRSVSVGLLVGGIFLMLSAIFMDTTRGGFHNIGLLNQQQTVLMFGGFIFIAGVILFAAAKAAKAKETTGTEEPAAGKAETIATNRWWAARSLGEKVIWTSACAALLSAFLNWTYVRTDVGMSGANSAHTIYYDDIGSGLGIVGVLLLCFWIYPITALWKEKRIGVIGGVTCSVLPLIFSIWYIVDVLTDSRNTARYVELTGGDYISTGPGLWLFAFASLGSLMGLVTHFFYEPPQLSRDDVVRKFLEL